MVRPDRCPTILAPPCRPSISRHRAVSSTSRSINTIVCRSMCRPSGPRTITRNRVHPIHKHRYNSRHPGSSMRATAAAGAHPNQVEHTYHISNYISIMIRYTRLTLASVISYSYSYIYIIEICFCSTLATNVYLPFPSLPFKLSIEYINML